MPAEFDARATVRRCRRQGDRLVLAAADGTQKVGAAHDTDDVAVVQNR